MAGFALFVVLAREGDASTGEGLADALRGAGYSSLAQHLIDLDATSGDGLAAAGDLKATLAGPIRKLGARRAWLSAALDLDAAAVAETRSDDGASPKGPGSLDTNPRLPEALKALKAETPRTARSQAFASASEDLAWRLWEAWIPAESVETAAACREWRAAYGPPAPAEAQVPNQLLRSKLELVDWRGRKAVRKTFRPDSLDFLKREIAAREDLAGLVWEVSPILEHGENFLVMPYYDDTLRWRDGGLTLFPLRLAQDCMHLAKRVYDAGYAIMDWHPGAVLVDRAEGLKLVDLEYAHRYVRRPGSFAESFDVLGPRPGFPGPLPRGRNCGYAHAWRPLVGAGFANLNKDLLGQLRAKRYIHWLLRRLPDFLIARAGFGFCRLRDRVRPRQLQRQGDFVTLGR